jgi:hypothetical protein
VRLVGWALVFGKKTWTLVSDHINYLSISGVFFGVEEVIFDVN